MKKNSTRARKWEEKKQRVGKKSGGDRASRAETEKLLKALFILLSSLFLLLPLSLPGSRYTSVFPILSELYTPPFRIHRNLNIDSARPHGYVSARSAPRDPPLSPRGRRYAWGRAGEEERVRRKRDCCSPLSAASFRHQRSPLSVSSPFPPESLTLIFPPYSSLDDTSHRERSVGEEQEASHPPPLTR